MNITRRVSAAFRGIANYLPARFNADLCTHSAGITPSYPIGRPTAWGYLDSFQLEPMGTIRVHGWCLGASGAEQIVAPMLRLNGTKTLEPQFTYSVLREDVAAQQRFTDMFCGRVFEYLARDFTEPITFIEVLVHDRLLCEYKVTYAPIKPHYEQLLNSTKIFGRDEIYLYGAPNEGVHPTSIHLARMLSGEILDFGCGKGPLLKHLLKEGQVCCGIELDRPEIRSALSADVAPIVTLYDGNFPMPFDDARFESVISIEVLEHIPEPERAIVEIARVCRKRFVMSVPDMSAVPICHPNFVVPWHLLESTHVNFFTQASLHALLCRYFSKVTFARIGPVTVNSSMFYTSLVAICDK